MAKDNGAAPAEAAEDKPKTKYQLFKLTGEGEVTRVDGTTQAVELFALLPGEFEGNVYKQAHAEYGDGEYAKTSITSFDRKPVRVDPTPRVKIG